MLCKGLLNVLEGSDTLKLLFAFPTEKHGTRQLIIRKSRKKNDNEMT